MKRLLCLMFLCATTSFAVTDEAVLGPLVGPSMNNCAESANRFAITRDGNRFRVRFQAVYGRTMLRGVLERAKRDELEKIAELVELVPVGAVDYYFLNPASVYFHVRFQPDEASSLEVREVERQVVRTPYVPAHVILEVMPTHGTHMVQLHFLQAKGPEMYKSFVFSGLHMASERVVAERAACVFDFGWD